MKPVRSVHPFRAIVWALVAAGLLLAWFTAPKANSSSTPPSDFTALVRVAESDNTTNNAQAKGAPQQQVVNGWHTNDLLKVITMQNNALLDRADAQRGSTLTVLVLIVGLGLCADRVGSAVLTARAATSTPPDAALAGPKPPSPAGPGAGTAQPQAGGGGPLPHAPHPGPAGHLSGPVGHFSPTGEVTRPGGSPLA